jgi:chromosome segregation ATPase
MGNLWNRFDRAARELGAAIAGIPQKEQEQKHRALHIFSLRQEIQKLQALARAHEGGRDKLLGALHESKEEVERLKLKVVELSHELVNFENAKVIYEDQIARTKWAEQDASTAKSRVAGLESDLEGKKNVIGNLKNRISRLKDEELLMRRAERLEKRVTALLEERHHLLHKVKLRNERLHHLKSVVSSHQKYIVKQKGIIEELRELRRMGKVDTRRLDELSREKEEMKEILQSISGENERLTNERNEALATLNANSIIHKGSKAVIDQFKEAMDTVSEARRVMEKQRETIFRLEEENAKLKTASEIKMPLRRG